MKKKREVFLKGGKKALVYSLYLDLIRLIFLVSYATIPKHGKNIYSNGSFSK